MNHKKDKKGGITTNHQDCIIQMDTLHTKLGEKEEDYNNLLLQNNTLKSIVEKQYIEISDLKKQLCDSQSQIKDLQSQIQGLSACIISPASNANVVDTPEYIQLELERNELAVEVEKMKGKQNKMETILDSLGVKDNFDEFIKFIKFIYDNKNDFMEFINMKKNNIKYDVEKDDKYISLKNINEEILKDNQCMKSQIDELNNKFNKMDSNIEDNILFKQLKEQNVLLSENNKTLNDNFNKLNKDFETLKKKQGAPTPSNSNETKSKKKNSTKKNNKEEEIKLPDNLLEVVYHRYIYINNNNYISKYILLENKKYLKCCNTEYKEKEISNENLITCKKCYKTYKLSEGPDVTGCYKIIKFILPEHIIPNERDLLDKIKCNKCNYLYKKEIDLCIKCKNIEDCEIIEYEKPNEEDEGYETKIALAGKCYFNIEYISGIFDKAYKEGLVKSDFKALIDYVKKNKLMDEKQKNIITNKIVRCHDIYDIYNLDKYINIKSYIKRLEFSLKAISKINDSSFRIFKNNLVEKLDNYLENYDNSTSENTIKEDEKIEKEHKKCENKMLGIKCVNDGVHMFEDKYYCNYHISLYKKDI